jgi:tetratricopeptide (TPR) repeat protein
MKNHQLLFSRLFLPSFVFNAFLDYRDTFKKFLNKPVIWKKLIDKDENKIFLMRQLIHDPSVNDHLKMVLMEFVATMDDHLKEKFLAKTYKDLVKKSYNTRNFIQFEFFLKKIGEFDPVFEKFYRLSSRQYLKSDVSIQEWMDLSVIAEANQSDVTHRIVGQLAVKFLHEENVEQAEKFFNKRIQLGKIENNIHISIGILKLYIKQLKKDQAKEFYNKLILNAENEHQRNLLKLKFFEVASELGLIERKERVKIWEDLFEALFKMGLNRDKNELFQELKEMFSSIGKNNRMLLDIRVCKNEQQELLTIVKEKLVNKLPFSLIRLGDGESYGLTSSKINSDTVQSDQMVREMKWWNQSLPKDLKNKIVSMLHETIDSCDVIGIPSIFRFARAMDNLDIPLLSKSDTRGSWMVLEYVLEQLNDGKYKNALFVEHRCHQVIFRKEDIVSMAAFASKIIIVSQYSQEMLQTAFEGIPIETVQIPAERLKSDSLPYKIDEKIEVLKSKLIPGTLVLVASGFAGKYFLKVARDHSAVGLDVGAMADYWVGLKTRQVSDLV